MVGEYWSNTVHTDLGVWIFFLHLLFSLPGFLRDGERDMVEGGT